MTHKNAPPRTPEQERMEAFWHARLAQRGTTCGFSRDERGEYHAEFARDAWAAWQEARPAELELKAARYDRLAAEAHWTDERDMGPGGYWWVSVSVRQGRPSFGVAIDAKAMAARK